MKRCLFVLAALVALSVAPAILHAQSTVYWDRNGSDPGGLNAVTFGDGIWSDVEANWNPLADGTGTTAGWVAGNHAVFSAGTDVQGDPIVDAQLTITGTQAAASVTIEEGYVQILSGVIDTPIVNVNAGATLGISTILNFTTTPGKITLNNGTYTSINYGHAGSYIRNSQSLEINGTGTLDYNDPPGLEAATDCECTIYTPVSGNAILGTGGTVSNGGAGTLIKTGIGEVRYQGAGLPLTTYAKLRVEEGLFRLGFSASVQDERGFGAVPLAPLADAITLDGGNIGTSFTLATLHANRGITVGPNGGGLVGNFVIPGTLSGSGTLNIRSGSTTLSNAGNAATFSGKLAVKNGTLVAADDAILGAAPGSPVADQITLGDSTPTTPTTGTLSISGSTTLNANRGIVVDNVGRLNVATGGNTVTYNGSISGAGKFTKMGDGTVVSSGTHSHSGGTDINGRLVVNGSLAGNGPVAVKTSSALGANGILGGTGSVAGLVTVESGASIAPGDVASIGTITLNAGLTLASGSVLSFDLGTPTTGDRINVGGTTTIDGGTVNVNNLGGLGTGTYTLIDYAGALGGSFANLALGTTPAGFTYSLLNTGSTIDLSVTAVAAPDGDYNNDGNVDAADYVLWRKNPGAFGGDPAGYTTWRQTFGQPSPGSGAGGAVPEPSTVAMLLLVGLAGFAARRRA